MGQYLATPVTAKESGKGENDQLKYGMSSMQGWRVCMVRTAASNPVSGLNSFFQNPVRSTCLGPFPRTHARTCILNIVQEDAHIVKLDLGDPHATGLFAVFDGHGGKLVAKYAAKHLARALNDTDHFDKRDGDLGLAFAQAFYKIDEELDTPAGMQELRELAGVGARTQDQTLFGDVGLQGIDLDADDDEYSGNDTRNADDTADDRGDKLEHHSSSREFVQSALARDSVIRRDEDPDTRDADADSDDFAEHKASGMGCTAVAAMVRNGEVTVANTGDSRCVISRNGVAEPLTLDHKPVLLEEAERIMNAGGFVRDNRVNGALNVSRTLGDLDFKRNTNLPHTHQMVVATPDITAFELQKGDEFVILACDGIWDVLSNQEAVDFVRKRIKAGQCLQEICEEMCDHCLAPNLQGLCRGADNMSVIIVLFKGTAGDLLRGGLAGLVVKLFGCR